MFDFLDINTITTKDGLVVEPEFATRRTKDLLIRGGDFYAIWNEEAGLWSTDKYTAVELIDKEIAEVAKKCRETGATVRALYLRNGKNKKIDEFNKYCKDRMWDNTKQRGLDEKLVFSNSPVRKEDYASMRLPYPLEKGPTENWDNLVSVLYSPEERMKIEWTIGCIMSGDSKKIQKCVILYGDKGTGKSTIINVIQDLLTVSYNEDGKPYERYFSTFDAKSLGSSNGRFALESFRNNPLVSIQHESNLSKLDDNTRLNSLISHEEMLMEVKNKSAYSKNFNTFLIMATNNPVKITDAKSGLLRRIIDISPTGDKIPRAEYNRIKEGIKFEKSGIAWKCLDIYKHNKHIYDDYVPIGMLSATNDLYNFLFCSDEYTLLRQTGNTVMKEIYPRYKLWCESASIKNPMAWTPFKEELKAYFKSYKERDTLDDGTRVRNRYLGFKYDAFNKETSEPVSVQTHDDIPEWLQLSEQSSKLDILLKDCPAQYATEDEKPKKAWDDVTTVLSDISTSKLHYVRPPIEHIVIDLDIHGEDGKKSLAECIKAIIALGLPPTYTETSKSGNGLHLHYIYTGDVDQLSRLIVPNVEIKIFTGKMSLRRKLSLCNDLDISTISSGLPLKERKKTMIDFDTFKTVEALEKEIIANIQKKRVGSTVQSMSLIQSDLEKAYNSGLSYDLSRMYGVLMNFAMSSHNSRDRAIDICHNLKLVSKDYLEGKKPLIDASVDKEKVGLEDIRMFDWEVFPNYTCIAYETAPWKATYIINPTSADIERIVKMKLGGFNCKSYDNNIMYARMMGYDNPMCYKLSANLVSADKKRQKDSQMRDAKNLSEIDIYEMCTKKQSLKKWEIELKRKKEKNKETGEWEQPYKMLEHMEANVDWEQPLPESMFKEVAEYCMNDVIATRAVAEANKSDFKARGMLADISGLPLNESTNNHTTRFIFGNDRNPQSQFNYYFMGIPKEEVDLSFEVAGLDCDWNYTVFKDGQAYFPDYTYEYDNEKKKFVSMYRGEEVGEGGYVYAEPGIYRNVVTFDVASMHPSSIEALNLFGDIYTKRFSEIKQARIYIKHKEYDKAKELLGGALAKYLDNPDEAKSLAQALKIVINSVYGLTAAGYPNAFRDERNKDNIVAKRGALFMVNLKHEVQRRGFTVVHIKTDSIKVADPTPEIAQFISDYGKLYGYIFEVEAEYDRICLINDAVYIAKYKEPEIDEDTGEEIWWSATGTRFQVPYVYKTLFSHQNIDFYDMCEVFSVQTRMYLDMNENMPDVTDAEKEYKKVKSNVTNEHDSAEADWWKRLHELEDIINSGHKYEFVGRVGEFTPVTRGGGILLRKSDSGYSSVGGTKGYRWLESDRAKVLIDKGDTSIDISYYNNLVDDAIAEISKFGDFDEFVS